MKNYLKNRKNEVGILILSLLLTSACGGGGKVLSHTQPKPQKPNAASEEDPLPSGAEGIRTVADFAKIKEDPAGHFVILNDLDFTNKEMPELPTLFFGTLDGRNHSIKNLKLKPRVWMNSNPIHFNIFSPYAIEGLQRQVAALFEGLSGSIENIEFVNPEISGECVGTSPCFIDAGLITISAGSNAVLKNIKVTGADFKGNRLGGLVWELGGEISNSSFTGKILGKTVTTPGSWDACGPVGGLAAKAYLGSKILRNTVDLSLETQLCRGGVGTSLGYISGSKGGLLGDAGSRAFAPPYNVHGEIWSSSLPMEPTWIENNRVSLNILAPEVSAYEASNLAIGGIIGYGTGGLRIIGNHVKGQLKGRSVGGIGGFLTFLQDVEISMNSVQVSFLGNSISAFCGLACQFTTSDQVLGSKKILVVDNRIDFKADTAMIYGISQFVDFVNPEAFEEISFKQILITGQYAYSMPAYVYRNFAGLFGSIRNLESPQVDLGDLFWLSEGSGIPEAYRPNPINFQLEAFDMGAARDFNQLRDPSNYSTYWSDSKWRIVAGEVPYLKL